MANDQTSQLRELKKIANLIVDRERHRLAAVKEELSRVDEAQDALKQQIAELANAKEADPLAMLNAQAYLEGLSGKARQLTHERHHASERTKAQREKIKTALASKIRIDGMEPD